MTKDEMLARMTMFVQRYIDDFDQYGHDPALVIDPKDFYMEIQTAADRDNDIYNSDATVEASAVSEGLANQDGMDYQSSRNWDIYPLKSLLFTEKSGTVVPDKTTIKKIVEKYIKYPDNSRTPYTY
ncbi:MAG: hypothetical protein K2M87_00495 [Muribaculaceae bacterium]|nr:hypothetical protein [Muribaculaceae bacterium]